MIDNFHKLLENFNALHPDLEEGTGTPSTVARTIQSIFYKNKRLRRKVVQSNNPIELLIQLTIGKKSGTPGSEYYQSISNELNKLFPKSKMMNEAAKFGITRKNKDNTMNNEFYKILEDFDRIGGMKTEGFDDKEIEMDAMGKVSVTQDGDTTKYNDAETAEKFMNNDDNNQFTTEGDEFSNPDQIAKDMVVRYNNNENDVQTRAHDVPEPYRFMMDTLLPGSEKLESSNIVLWWEILRRFEGHLNNRPPVEDWDDNNQFTTEGFDSPRSVAIEIKQQYDMNEKNVQQIAGKSPEFYRAIMYTLYPNAEAIDGTNDYHEIVDNLEALFDEDDIQPPVTENNLSEGFGDYDDFDSNDETEYSTFDSNNPEHRKRLQQGTPVVLDPSICSNPTGDRTGIFVARSPSGHYGTVIRNCDGKEVNVHLSDIVSADITNNSIYEEYGLNFDSMLSEEISITTTVNPSNPENDTTTVTAIGNDSADDLAAMMANAGLSQGYSEYAPDVDDGTPDAAMPVANGPDSMIMLPPDMPMEGHEEEDEQFNAKNYLNNRSQEEKDESRFWDKESDRHEREYDDDDENDLEEAKHDDENDLYAYNQDAPNDQDLAAIDNDQEFWDEMGATDDMHAQTESLDDSPGDNFDDERDINNFRGEPSNNDLAAIDNDQEFWDEVDGVSEEKGDYYEAPIEEERDIEHSNSPHELLAKLDAILQGGGLNKSKRTYGPVSGGDNPMAMTENDLLEDNERELITQRQRTNEDDETKEVCPHCDGSGKDRIGYDEYDCKACEGSGKISKDTGQMNEDDETSTKDCPCCKGGNSECSHGKDVCGTCDGTGKVPDDSLNEDNSACRKCSTELNDEDTDSICQTCKDSDSESVNESSFLNLYKKFNEL